MYRCRACVNEERRERYKRDQVPTLVTESRARTGAPQLSRHLYETILELHHHRCFISGCAGQPLVLMRVDEFLSRGDAAE